MIVSIIYPSSIPGLSLHRGTWDWSCISVYKMPWLWTSIFSVVLKKWCNIYSILVYHASMNWASCLVKRIILLVSSRIEKPNVCIKLLVNWIICYWIIVQTGYRLRRMKRLPLSLRSDIYALSDRKLFFSLLKYARSSRIFYFSRLYF